MIIFFQSATDNWAIEASMIQAMGIVEPGTIMVECHAARKDDRKYLMKFDDEHIAMMTLPTVVQAWMDQQSVRVGSDGTVVDMSETEYGEDGRVCG